MKFITCIVPIQVRKAWSLIDTATNTVVGRPIPVDSFPFGVAVTLDGSKVYVVNQGSNTVSVIDTVTNTVVGLPIPVGATPIAFGSFIQPHGCKDGGWLNFASSPGPFKNEGQCVSYFAKQP